MPFESLVGRIAMYLGFRSGISALVARLTELLWGRLIQVRQLNECPSDLAEARGRVRAYAAALVRAELLCLGLSAIRRDQVEDRVVSRLVERFIGEWPRLVGSVHSARVAA